MPWLSLKASGERFCLQLSGNKSWLYQQDILHPKACWHLQRAPVGPYGRTSLSKGHADPPKAHHICHVSTHSFFHTSFSKAAVQNLSALHFHCWKSWDLTLTWKAETKAFPLDVYFPHCSFQVQEEQELGYFPLNFLLVFIVFRQVYRRLHNTRRAAFPLSGFLYLLQNATSKIPCCRQSSLQCLHCKVSTHLPSVPSPRGRKCLFLTTFPKNLGMGVLPNEGRKHRTRLGAATCSQSLRESSYLAGMILCSASGTRL